MTRFLVTGASGLLGLNFGMEFADRHEVIGVVNRHSLCGTPFPTVQADLSQEGAVSRLLDKTCPEVILNCAALAQPDECERQPELTARLNTHMPGELAVEARERGVHLVHISTDSVFDGQRGAYCETDVPSPLNTYARSKLAGEQAVCAADPQALVARVVFYGWSLHGQRSLAEFFYYNLKAGKRVYGFTDAIFSPLLVTDLARLLFQMTEKQLSGIYHVFSPEPISKYEFGIRIARRFNLDERLITPVSVNAGGLAARRSPNLSMNIDKLTQALGAIPPGQDAGIEQLYQQWEAGVAERIRGMSDE